MPSSRARPERRGSHDTPRVPPGKSISRAERISTAKGRFPQVLHFAFYSPIAEYACWRAMTRIES